MNKKNFSCAALFALMLAVAAPACAQSEAFESFVEKQFYGNRIQLGSVLLNGSVQHTGSASDNTSGLISSVGFGAGLGLGQNVVLNFGYHRERSREALWVNPFEPVPGLVTTNTVQAGFRFLPNTRAGFLQLYIGLDFVWLRQDARLTHGSEPVEENRYAGLNVPLGLIIWLSTFMSISLEPLNFNLIGSIGDDVNYNGIYSLNATMLNPTFGITFLINGQKP